MATTRSGSRITMTTWPPAPPAKKACTTRSCAGSRCPAIGIRSTRCAGGTTARSRRGLCRCSVAVGVRHQAVLGCGIPASRQAIQRVTGFRVGFLSPHGVPDKREVSGSTPLRPTAGSPAWGYPLAGLFPGPQNRHTPIESQQLFARAARALQLAKAEGKWIRESSERS